MRHEYTRPTLPKRVRALIETAVYSRHSARMLFRSVVRTTFVVASMMGVPIEEVKIELAIRLAEAAREHAKTRPIETSYRKFRLGATIVTRGGGWYHAYNLKPLPDSGDEVAGLAPKFRACAEQRTIMQANDQGDINVELLVLVGEHHDNHGHSPVPCVACLRFFTVLPNHRNITVVMVNHRSGQCAKAELGELIDEANLEQVQCTCCHSRNGDGDGAH